MAYISSRQTFDPIVSKPGQRPIVRKSEQARVTAALELFTTDWHEYTEDSPICTGCGRHADDFGKPEFCHGKFKTRS